MAKKKKVGGFKKQFGYLTVKDLKSEIRRLGYKRKMTNWSRAELLFHLAELRELVD